MSLVEELTSLKTNLAQTREKFITDWTVDQYEQFKKRQSKLYRVNCNRFKESIALDGDTRNKLVKQTSLNEKALEEKSAQLELLKQELENYSKDIHQVNELNNQVSTEIQRTQHRIEHNQKALTSIATDSQHEELQLESDVYRECLDLQMRKISGGRLQFIFSSLDRKHPDVTCYFFTKISDEDRKYIVSECEPMVKGLEQLVDKLNETNNLKSFVVAMRKRFKQALNEKN